ncbi:hypothetical protein ACF0H5_014529 [Mactra antiquata]
MSSSIVWLLCFVCVCLSIIHAVDGSLPPEEGVCKSDADCGAQECCVGLDRRRFIFTHPTSGICRSLRYNGFACHVFIDRDPGNQQLHVHYCPCAEGLECRGTSTDVVTNQTVHHDPRCLPKQK